MKKKIFILFLLSFVSMSLISCRNEPTGTETSINGLIKMYSEGEIKQLRFIEKGTWVIGELTDEAINSKKYSDNKFKVKVISLESFQEELKKATGKSPEISVLSSESN